MIMSFITVYLQRRLLINPEVNKKETHYTAVFPSFSANVWTERTVSLIVRVETLDSHISIIMRSSHIHGIQY